MAISPQRLTIYLYSAHRAVIFAIAQLSCLALLLSSKAAGSRRISCWGDTVWKTHTALIVYKVLLFRIPLAYSGWLGGQTAPPDHKTVKRPYIGLYWHWQPIRTYIPSPYPNLPFMIVEGHPTPKKHSSIGRVVCWSLRSCSTCSFYWTLVGT